MIKSGFVANCCVAAVVTRSKQSNVKEVVAKIMALGSTIRQALAIAVHAPGVAGGGPAVRLCCCHRLQLRSENWYPVAPAPKSMRGSDTQPIMRLLNAGGRLFERGEAAMSEAY